MAEIAVIASQAAPQGSAPRSNSAIELATALSGVNDNIGPLFERWAQQAQRSQAAQAQVDALANSGTNFENAVRDGTLERTQNPWYIRSYETTAATSRGHQQVSALIANAPQWEEYNNPEAFAQRLDREIGGLGQLYTGPDQQAGFLAAANPLREQTLQANVGANVRRITQEHDLNTGQLVTETVMGLLAADPTLNRAPVDPLQRGLSTPNPGDLSGRGSSVSTPAPPRPPQRSTAPSTFSLPVQGGVIRPGGGYGRRSRPTRGASQDHNGLDYAVPVGTRVSAAASGTVSFANRRGGYGNTVIITHDDGSTTMYAHLSSIEVQRGARVTVGDQIALSGGARGARGSGTSTGPHLHFMYRDAQGNYQDPRRIYGRTIASRDGEIRGPTGDASPDANPRPTPEPTEARTPPDARAIYARLEPLREEYLRTGGTEAGWNAIVVNGVVAAGQNLRRSDVLDILSVDQGNGRGAITSIVGPTGESAASTVQQARYYIDQAAERESTRVVQSRRAALDLAGDNGRRWLWGRFSEAINAGTFDRDQAIRELQTGELGLTPQEANRAVSMLSEELSASTVLTRANLSIRNTGPGAADALSLRTRARTEGMSDSLQSAITAQVLSGDMTVDDADSTLAAAIATTERIQGNADSAASRARAEESHAVTMANARRGVRRWAEIRTRSQGIVPDVASRVPTLVRRPADRRALQDVVQGAVARSQDTNPDDPEAAYQAARRAAAAWVLERSRSGASRRAGQAAPAGLQAGNPRR